MPVIARSTVVSLPAQTLRNQLAVGTRTSPSHAIRAIDAVTAVAGAAMVVGCAQRHGDQLAMRTRALVDLDAHRTDNLVAPVTCAAVV